MFDIGSVISDFCSCTNQKTTPQDSRKREYFGNFQKKKKKMQNTGPSASECGKLIEKIPLEYFNLLKAPCRQIIGNVAGLQAYKNVWLSPVHIPGKENTTTDY